MARHVARDRWSAIGHGQPDAGERRGPELQGKPTPLILIHAAHGCAGHLLRTAKGFRASMRRIVRSASFAACGPRLCVFRSVLLETGRNRARLRSFPSPALRISASCVDALTGASANRLSLPH